MIRINLISVLVAASPNESPRRLILRRRPSRAAENNKDSPRVISFTCEKRLAYKAARCSLKANHSKVLLFSCPLSAIGDHWSRLHANTVRSSQVREWFCLGAHPTVFARIVAFSSYFCRCSPATGSQNNKNCCDSWRSVRFPASICGTKKNGSARTCSPLHALKSENK